MYVCGITPYDATHLGHAATYVTFDVINRALRDAGHSVDYVQNVTDIDDPLLERAVATGQDWQDLARRETATFRDDMQALGVLPPRDYVGAVEAMPLIVESIGRLRAAGAVYEVDGDLFFSVTADPHFGSVAGLDVHTMRHLAAERGGQPDRSGLHNPLDVLLWQRQRPDEPAWDTELGHGRPGWHIECAAIALDRLGAPIDIQGGGRDLAFPHHEACAAHVQVMEGIWPFARHYVHAGMVGLDGHKMSKSRGNLVFVRDLRSEGYAPAAIRLALLDHHYRTDWEWTEADMHLATRRLARWRMAAGRPGGPPGDRLLAELRECIADDLDTPRALRALDRWADAAVMGNRHEVGVGARVVEFVDALLGVRIDGRVAHVGPAARRAGLSGIVGD